MNRQKRVVQLLSGCCLAGLFCPEQGRNPKNSVSLGPPKFSFTMTVENTKHPKGGPKGVLTSTQCDTERWALVSLCTNSLFWRIFTDRGIKIRDHARDVIISPEILIYLTRDSYLSHPRYLFISLQEVVAIICFCSLQSEIFSGCR
jgi:hypothetical protein